MSKLQDFEILSKLGKGTFGVVEKAKSVKTGEIVALKQLLNHSAKEGFPITAMREITIVKKLNHRNVLKILGMIYEEPKVSNASDVVHNRGCFYTVSPYMTSDLVGLLENPNIQLQLPQIKCFMQQLLTGIQYIHDSKYLHRDIKAANILINSDGILKIADFGLARNYHGSRPTLGQGPGGGERLYTGLVVTRWYRPPEILLGERKYTTAVDIWGVGCVFGELFHKKPILSGKSDSHQCQLVFQLVGPPTNEEWPDSTSLPNRNDLTIGLTCRRSLESRFMPLMNDPLAVDLLSKMLTLDPYKRYNALDALNHSFFSSEPLPDTPQQLPKFEECHEIDRERFKKMSQGQTLTNSNSVIAPGAPIPIQTVKTNNNELVSESGFKLIAASSVSKELIGSFKPVSKSVAPISSSTINDKHSTGHSDNNGNDVNISVSRGGGYNREHHEASLNASKTSPEINRTVESSIFMPKKKKRPLPPPSTTNKKIQKTNDSVLTVQQELIPLSKSGPRHFDPITKVRASSGNNTNASDLSDVEDDITNEEAYKRLDLHKK